MMTWKYLTLITSTIMFSGCSSKKASNCSTNIGVNSYYDPYKGYSVEISNGYRYVYANALGDYIVTDNANYNPNVDSNLNWTILNRK